MKTFDMGAGRAAAFLMTRFRSFEERLGIATLAFAALFMLGQHALAHEYKAGDLEIMHPWSRAIPEGAKVAAGYVTIANHGATADRLVGAQGEIADVGQIHEMSVDAAGVMTMREVSGGVEIPAGQTVELKPGAMHIMFMQLKQAPEAGKKFKGTLTFEKAGAVAVEFAVEPIGGKPADEGHDAHKGHGG